MIAYASRTGTLRNLAALRAAGWRLMVSAKGALRPEGFPYALDNGAWWAFQNGQEFDEPAFMRAVDKIGAGSDWIVLPDIVAGGLRSLEFSAGWMARLRGVAPLMLAVQNGMEAHHVRPLVGCDVGIFVGGTTDWKIATMALWGIVAREAGCFLHVGRVNTVRRISMCAAAGADSFDGSSASRYQKNLWRLDSARNAPDLFRPSRAG